MHYRKLSDGEWALTNKGVTKIACCDCGLVHVFHMEATEKGIRYRAWRDKKATAAKRRKQR